LNAAENKVGIGDRRLRATSPIRGRPGLGPRAFRPDLNARQRVDLGNRPAAGADLDHFDHGNADRQSAALHEPILAGDLEAARILRFQIVDEADFRSRSAHVERHDVAEAAFLRNMPRQHGAAGGPGLDEPHREAPRHVHRRQSPGRGHEIKRTGDALRTQALFQPRKIARHDRLDIGVHAGRRPALIFAHFRRDFARQRERETRREPRQDIARFVLVHRIDIGMQETNRHAFDRGCLQCADEIRKCALVERLDDLATRAQPLRDRQAQIPRHQRRRPLHPDVVLLEAILVRHLDGVAEAFRDKQRGFRAFALDHRVGCQSGAVDDGRQIGRAQTGVCENLLRPFEHGDFGRPRCRQKLVGPAPAAVLDRKIGKRAADINGQSRGFHAG
jgi:hypothetical protein